MKPERWQEIRAVFEEALDVRAADRLDFVRTRCGEDDELRHEVEQLLASDEATDDGTALLDRTPAFDALRPSCPPLLPGDHVGRYMIERTIGAGGMGVVYEATQTNPSRTVAVKVMNHGLRSASSARRFLFESEILAQLRHPGIAQVFESGTFTPPGATDDAGVPFFAMECIEGARDLATFVQDEQLERERRIELLCEICDAVHHGHLQGVVHRDLKPANVLVDRHGRAKVIDFGIARLSSPGEAQHTELTQDGQMLGTLNYASPEQIDGRTVDARADVYSLGVIAFQLLAGRLPHELEDTSLPAAARIIVEEDAPPLGDHDRTLAGDLEVIVGKALEKDPSARYQSASELRQDLRNFLADRPITARPPTALYQLRKLARRHRAAFTIATIAAVLVVTGLAAVSWQYLQITEQNTRIQNQNTRILEQHAEVQRQNERIRAEQGRTTRIAEFLEDILEQANSIARGKDYTMREALDSASLRIPMEFGDEPDLEARIRHVIGDTYDSLSVYDAARIHLTRALELRREHSGPDALDTVDTEDSLAMTLWSLDELDAALEMIRHALDVRTRVLGERDPATLLTRHNFAQILKTAQHTDEAIREYSAVLELRGEVLGEDNRRTIITKCNLGKMMFDLGDGDAARELLSEALEQFERTLGHDHFETVHALDLLGQVARRDGDLEFAERAHRRARRVFAERLGEDHEHTLASSMNLMWVLLTQGRNAEAAEIAEPTLVHCERVLGPDHAHTLRILRMAAAAFQGSGDAERAGPLFAEAMRAARSRYGVRHEAAARAAQDYAFWLMSQSRAEEGLELIRQSEKDRALLEPDRTSTAAWLCEGVCLTRLRRYDEAAETLERCLDASRRQTGPASPETQAALRCLVSVYEGAGRSEDLARARDALRVVEAARDPEAAGR